MALRPYTGKYPEAQELAATKAGNAAVAAGSQLVCRQVLSVPRVLVDEIEDLRGEVKRLSAWKVGAEAFLREIKKP